MSKSPSNTINPEPPRQIGKRQGDHQRAGCHRACHDKRHALAQARLAPVGQRAEQRQQEQRQDVVQRHHKACDIVPQGKAMLENQWNHKVIRLPEGADGEKRQADQKCALVVEFHMPPSLRKSARILTSIVTDARAFRKHILFSVLSSATH